MVFNIAKQAMFERAKMEEIRLEAGMAEIVSEVEGIALV
jgi:hypothetical protein